MKDEQRGQGRGELAEGEASAAVGVQLGEDLPGLPGGQAAEGQQPGQVVAVQFAVSVGVAQVEYGTGRRDDRRVEALPVTERSRADREPELLQGDPLVSARLA